MYRRRYVRFVRVGIQCRLRPINKRNMVAETTCVFIREARTNYYVASNVPGVKMHEAIRAGPGIGGPDGTIEMYCIEIVH